MSTLTLDATPRLDGDRSVTAQAGTLREASGRGVGRAGDPEVAAVAKRRRFSDDYKRRILDEIAANPGKSGMILRREGLYSSSLPKWREQRGEMSTQRKPTSTNKKMHNELAKLQRENTRLKMKLQKAEGLIDLQKKTSEILELMSRNESDES
jgi:transposase